jgi:radical SAM protein with 4Fe4S-binding SPASM domain
MTTIAAYDPKPTVIWELTRACDLACRNCPNTDHETLSPLELRTYEAYKTIDEIASVRPRRFVITGGDPLRREDLGQIIDYACRRGLDPALTLSPTAITSEESLRSLRGDGLKRVIVPLDDAAAEGHDAWRGVAGSFRTTLHLIGTALTAGLKVEVNTLVSRRNVGHLRRMHEQLVTLGVASWNLYFLVPRRGMREAEMLDATVVEQLFEVVQILRAMQPMPIRVFEAPHERRYELQIAAARREGRLDAMFDTTHRNAFKGYAAVDSAAPEEIIFITHSGEVWPDELLPMVAGNVRYSPLAAIHRQGAIFASLRDRTNLKGKCGWCEFRSVCGGSRARAYAMTGDPFASDPLCAYRPGALALTSDGLSASC